MDRKNQNFDVIIVGGGIVALTACLILAQEGFKIGVICNQLKGSNNKNTTNTRSLAVTQTSMRIFDTIGLGKKIKKNSYSFDEIEVFDAHLREISCYPNITFNHRQKNSGSLGQIIKSEHMRKIIFNEVTNLKNVSFVQYNNINQVFYNDQKIFIRINKYHSLSANICIVADGKNSALSKALGVKGIKKDYKQSSLTFDFSYKNTDCLRSKAYQFFFPGGPLALLPLSKDIFSVVWTLKVHEAKRLHNLSSKDFLFLFNKKCMNIFRDIKLLSKININPLSHYNANKYVHDRFVLVGDSAHFIHPIAGQGLNIGLKDVALLAEVIVDHYRLGLDIGNPIHLKKYQTLRRIDNAIVARGSEYLNAIFSKKSNILSFARGIGFNAINNLALVKNFLTECGKGNFGYLPRLSRGKKI